MENKKCVCGENKLTGFSHCRTCIMFYGLMGRSSTVKKENQTNLSAEEGGKDE